MSHHQAPPGRIRAGALITGLPVALIAGLFLLPTPENPSAAEDPNIESSSFAVVGARVFDGQKVLDQATVWVQNGRIHAIDSSAERTLELPAGIEVIDGQGHTLLPGLLDAHVHTYGTARADAVRFGVTTLLDQFTAPTELRPAQAERDNGATDQSDLFSAGILATVDGGHGTQFGITVPQVDGPEAADSWVEERLKEGSDWIKIVVEPGWNGELPTLQLDTVKALVEAAHRRQRLAVAHVSTLDDALAVSRLGVDGLVHIWRDRIPNAEQVQELKNSGLFIIPTLVVAESMADPSPSMDLATDWDERLSIAQRQSLERRFPARAKLDLQIPIESLRRLAAAGVPVLAGSDAPNPGTAMGLSLHREMQLLAQADLTPTQVLTAATAAAANAFNIPDRGRIAKGFIADLVLVAGDATADIGHSRQLVKVWKSGREIGPKPAKPQNNPAQEPVQPAEQTLLADFEQGVESLVGAGWAETTDQRMGGKSEVTLEARNGALVLRGELRGGSMFPWSGAILFPGPTPMYPVDFSSRTELRFRARGDGRSYSVMVFSGDMQGLPVTLTFTAEEQWTEVVMPLDDFTGADISRLGGIAFSAAGRPGVFEFQLDDVEIR